MDSSKFKNLTALPSTYIKKQSTLYFLYKILKILKKKNLLQTPWHHKLHPKRLLH